MSLSDRVHEVEKNQAVQGEQLRDHERVLRALETNLEKLVEHVADFKNRVYVLIAVVLVTSSGGSKVLSSVINALV